MKRKKWKILYIRKLSINSRTLGTEKKKSSFGHALIIFISFDCNSVIHWRRRVQKCQKGTKKTKFLGSLNMCLKK